jgi:hypothetical protein
MEINNNDFSISYQQMKPTKPVEPTPPPGGNIENRQPPSEPTAPIKPTSSKDALVDVFA